METHSSRKRTALLCALLVTMEQASGFSIFGTGAADLGVCLTSSRDPACFSGALVNTRALAGGITAPGAPGRLSVTVSGSSVTFVWSPPTSGDPALSYILEAGSTSGAANLANLATDSTATTLSASGVGAGTYFVRVRAQNAGGVSPASNEVVVVVGAGGCASAPSAPSGVTSSVSVATVTITWNAPAGGCAPTSYVLQAGSASGLSNLASFNTGGVATTYVASGIGVGTYYVRVLAANTAGMSTPSNEVTAIVSSALGPCKTEGNPPASYDCVITTVAGYGIPDVGDGAVARQAILESPIDVLAAADGSLIVADTNNHRVRRFTPGGSIRTVAGTGTADNRQIADGVQATDAQLRFPSHAAFGPDGLLYIADTRNYRVRRIGSDGIITTVAGKGDIFSNPAAQGMRAIDASISGPTSVAFDSHGDLYVPESDRNRVWRVGRDGILALVAGTGELGSSGDGGPALQARVSAASIGIDQARNLLYIGALRFGTIRRVDLTTGVITSITGAEGQWLRTDAGGNVLFASYCQIKRLDAQTGNISVIAGDGNCGFAGDGGSGLRAMLSSPASASIDASGTIYIADRGNNRIRRVMRDGIIETVAGGRAAVSTNAPATQTTIFDGQGIVLDRAGNVFFGDLDHCLIRRLDRDRIVKTVAGNGQCNYGGDGGHPLSASFSGPVGLAFDPAGNLFFVDQTPGSVIRMISPGASGVIEGAPDERIITVAGSVKGVQGEFADHGSADGGPARNAVFFAVRGLAIDSTGAVYVADWQDSRIRKITPGRAGHLTGASDDIVTTVAGNGVASSTGDGGLAWRASVNRSARIAVDSQRNLFVYSEDGLIRRVDFRSGIIGAFARTDDIGGVYGSLTIGSADNLYFGSGTPAGTKLIRIDTLTGTRTQIAGAGQLGFAGDGGDARDATFRGANWLAFDRDGNIYLLDNGNFRIRKITFTRRPATPSTVIASNGRR